MAPILSLDFFVPTKDVKVLRYTHMAALVAFTLLSATPSHAQSETDAETQVAAGDLSNTSSSATVDGIEASNTVDTNTTASSGGNVFDFSSGGSKPMGYAPALPSFAGGACMGVSAGVSASLPGFGIGGGRSWEDKACQRRNWVQTLIGAAQHMPEAEANALRRAAIAVMMEDPYLEPAFERLGYSAGASKKPSGSARATASTSGPGGRRAAPSDSALASMAPGCVAVIPSNASAAFEKLVAKRGCEIRRR